MKNLLYQLARYGEISWLSFHFAEFIADHEQQDSDQMLALTAALLCEANRNGNVCIELAEYAGKPMFPSNGVEPDAMPVADSVDTWRAQLGTSKSVGKPGIQAPITLDRNRLYLNRYWHYENSVAERIRHKLETVAEADLSAHHLETIGLMTGETDSDQQNAVSTAVSHLFSVISGGPGSGKTSTVVRIIALLLALDPDCRIALAAPTGKAAARMMESIRQRIGDQQPSAAFPADASTIHRLLRYRRGGFGHDARHPLPVDCVIIDEASMIDLKLMYHLLEALPESARLILLGDRDQLASVAAGNVLGDITGHGHSLETGGTDIGEAIALLRYNYRFDHASAIGELARQVNLGQVDAALELLQQNDRGLYWRRTSGDRVDREIMQRIFDAYQSIFDAESPDQALDIYQGTRVLCATNEGPFGVDRLNQEISTSLLASRQRAVTDRFHGLPVMITRNRHDLGLYNGDTGILWQFDGGLRACFRDSDASLRELAVNRLPDFVPAWACTVHKSQGSEFDSVLLLMPAEPESEVLSRELLYTAITRARRQFTLHASSETVAAAIARLTRRHSGLAQKLGWPD